MLSENMKHGPKSAPKPAFDLMPWGIVTGASAHRREGRMIEAQGAINRFQVWIGDLIIHLTAYRTRQRPVQFRTRDGAHNR